MTIIQNLDQHYIDHELRCPEGKSRIEIVDPHRTGLYIEVRAASPGAGTYYLRYKDSAGKTCHEKIGRTTEVNLGDARAAAVQRKATLARTIGRVPAAAPAKSVPIASPRPADAGLTLETFMTEHYFPHAKVHKRSWARDEQLYRLRIKAKFGDLPLSGITRLEVQRFQNALVAEGLSNASVNHHVQLLRRICNLAVSWELLSKNVLARIPLLTLDNQIEGFLNEQQVTSLVAVLKTDANRTVSLILMFLLATGARLNEALCAEWKQVDLENAVWKIPATNSKSKRMKHLPLNTSALWVIEQLDTQGTSELLFPSPATGKPFTTVTRQWYRLRKKAGIPANFRIHDLRHTFASRMVSAGRSLFEVQKLLGHADPRTTQRYTYLAMKSAQEASNAAAFAIA
ncbi:tyrosine-type recombinase/integrase [Ramlibacter sp.]|uniref:tyrosine-type recombinase/integrase n=1 Tax=Ramlibacter sp. TaxID=1917967 RepID=UPI002BF85F47|nr:tyrosine-type recombinase/integrase [Ramlibacter sp.]HWI82692.1 tyrosine-type recombinase/integrase [Ramlibacter sp.]